MSAKAALIAIALSTTAIAPLAFAAPAATPAPGTITVPPIAFKERTLANGLKVYTSLDKTTPNVSIQVWYGVGSKDDPQGRSGFAHLFEHLMFKATRDMPSETMDRLTEDVGGFNNAFTADDMTAYYEVVPAGHLERLLWAEAQRMGSLVVDQASFLSERDVVKEELRQRVLANPYGRFFTLMIPDASFTTHPYKRAGIGSIEELDASTIDDVLTFHQTYYRPDNASLIVVGNYDEAQLNAWVDKYFAPLKTPSAPLPRVTVKEPARTATKTVTGYAPNVPLPALAITWQGPSASDPDAAALKVLDAILTAGKSSRLYNSLVYEKQIAQEAFSNANLSAQPDLFYVGAIMAGEHTLDEGQVALLAQIKALRDAPVPADELAEAKTELTASAVRERETIDGRASVLGAAIVLEGDVSKANAGIADIQAVTAADVQRVAKKYLGDNNYVVVRYLDESKKPAGETTAAVKVATPVVSKPFTGTVVALAPEGKRQSPPPVGTAVAPVLPAPVEKVLANGLRVIVARSSDLPLVTADLTVRAGAASDPAALAGAASMAAGLLTEGTTSRNAVEVARQTEALGANLGSAAGWESASVTLNVMPQNLEPAMTIMADVARNPAYAQEELDRNREQALDGFQVAMKTARSIAGFVTSPIIYAGTPFGHVSDGTPETLKALKREDLVKIHDTYWRPDNAILIITGDITPETGFALAEKAYGDWKKPATPLPAALVAGKPAAPRSVVVDLPGSGQASVLVAKRAIPRADPRYYPGLVANSVLGGGYSARLNQEVRVKRGLAYGANSSLTARQTLGGFTASTSTKNETASDVVVLIKGEMGKLAKSPASVEEMTARKSVLIGGFGRSLGTTDGLADVLGDLALYGVDLKEIQVYTQKVDAVTPAQVQAFAAEVLNPDQASVIVVGDAKVFGDKLKAVLPNAEFIPLDQLDLNNPSLKKGK